MEDVSVHISKWKKPISNGYIIYDSTWMILWKRQKKKNSSREWGAGLQGLPVRDGATAHLNGSICEPKLAVKAFGESWEKFGYRMRIKCFYFD